MCADGEHFVSGGCDGILRLWELPDCTCGNIEDFEEHVCVCKGQLNEIKMKKIHYN